MPQTGADLVGAGYPISRPLLALLGGNGNLTQPNVPVHTNLDFGFGGLTDATLNTASAYTVPVPVVPGAVISRVSVLIGATSACVTGGWAALYTGTGSAPGTVGVSPTLIGQSSSIPTAAWTAAASISTGSVNRFDFPFATPQTITSVHAPYGYIYVTTMIAPAPSVISMTAAASAGSLWYSTSPYGIAMTSASTSSVSAPSYLGSVAVLRIANPPVVLLS